MAATVRCRTCDQAIAETLRFCPACGEVLPGEGAGAPGLDTLPLDAGELRTLVREKARLGADLEELADRSAVRELSPEERYQWEQTYARWRDVASELTLQLDRIRPRSDDDRRSRGHPSPAVERRSADDRRDPFWRRAP